MTDPALTLDPRSARVLPPALFTDLYQLTMMHGYWRAGLHEQTATFDLYYRRNPFRGGYGVWAGLGDAVTFLERARFTPADLAFLADTGLFPDDFLAALADWRFTARVDAFPEGAVVFPNEPLLSVTGPLWEAQLVETALLNILNFQTLIATKAARVVGAAASSPHGGTVLEFGARRAQGPDGALGAARAAFVGGVTSTSNVLAGARYGIPLAGTHAHAWVESFPSELDAFRAYAALYPDATTLLLDTYDTLASGLPNALTVARELQARGHALRGVRLDSGDLAYLSRTVRARLDEAGFPDVRIVASNDLDEFVIESVIREGGRVDIYGVGTRLATGGGEGGGALGGVYKLVALNGEDRMKLTGDPAKASVPGLKRVWRGEGADGRLVGDVITRDRQTPRAGEAVSDPTNPLRRITLPEGASWRDPRVTVMDGGERRWSEPLEAARERARTDLQRTPEGTTRLLNPHLYRVSLGAALAEDRARLMEQLRARMGGT
ncbi:nicotinate phosphoribosyltransferase [Deinococcus maricopensis]|uniref:Nicotinate phosphoribosyltransferase n=1 Tax=Deinococcus maricopensis (strain DSM 21211 / LMG 22137 / NRRL B-23946 / LB-34) TaxID=709986 RepID=E8U9D7_DEIML|nr:nicotinate phosphoribosyltransferase [Deinococcus maricopensis]ADV67676.1 nicotinate phosphoribosyltransferase [Deinococcus maricopensis DSM 21211]